MGQIVSDNFDRADSNTLGANWTPESAGRDAHILTNRAVNGSTTLDTLEFFSGASWTGGNDHYSELNVIKTSTAGARAGCGCRLSTTNVKDGYLVSILETGVSATHELNKMVSSVATLLGSWTQTVQTTDVVRCEAQGTTIRSKVNGVQKVSVTDSAIATGNPGVYLETNGAVDDSEVDNWAAGDFAGAAGAVMVSVLALVGAQ